MTDSDDWITPALEGMSKLNGSVKKDRAHRHGRHRTTHMANMPGSMHHESRNPPVAQVLPHTPDFDETRFTTNAGTATTTTTTTTPCAASSRSKRHADGRKALFGSADKKKGESSRWKGADTSPGLLSPEQDFAALNMEETMNQTQMYADSELRRMFGSPHRNNQGHRSTVPQTSPNSYNYNPNNAYPHISPEFRSHSNLSSHYGSNVSHSNDLYTSTNYAGMPRSHDLNDWQRIQQHQLQAQLEHLHLTSQALNSGMPYLGNTIGLGGHGIGGVGCNDELGKVEGLIRAKESLIHEKNMVIERQKLEISHLQNQRRELELQERARLFPRPIDHSDKYVLKVQECEYEIATLRAQIAETTAIKDAEIDKITKKLGEAEYELQKLAETNRDADEDRIREFEQVKHKLLEKEKYSEGLREKYNKTRQKYENMKKKYGGIERYMEDLPTLEEQTKSNEMIKNLREKEILLKERITQLEVSLTEARQTIRTKELEVTNLETKETDLQLQVESFEEEISKLHTALGVAKDEAFAQMGFFRKGEIEKLKKDKEKYKHEVVQLKQVVDSKHQHMKKLQSQHHRSTQNLEERLKQEEDTITALKEALKSKEDELKAYKVSTRDLAAQSQELYEHNLSLEEQKETLEKLSSTEHLKGSQRLLREISGCVKDLQSLVEICEHTVEGEEPNVSALLGLRSSSGLSEHEEEESSPSLDTIKGRLKQTRQIRADVDRMRGLLQDKYANDIGNNCITQ
ncbi:centrosomal protein of 85 kDa-like [Amphiura filiformis]|uniref:centrosomal protein of 85 kDa-like n=1 Tax=Amphiura filiformis TaxID=82378 RepID=UPI003B218611